MVDGPQHGVDVPMCLVRRDGFRCRNGAPEPLSSASMI